ncbi:hypothetical protein [Lacticaseibacillus porcinae]|uniref:hypothetical protein n=1 Tax=Lacticaseibacillus porcinae TaxID=1123687 RepID=UPI0013DD92AD|nr:hypothetical protein [Lacticaseibacillus porcinae]
MKIFLALMGLCLLVLGAQFMSGRWLSMIKANATKQNGIAVGLPLLVFGLLLLRFAF